MKLHLTAQAPNEGARLLAQWVMHRHGGDLMKASSTLVVSPSVVQRIVADEIRPGTIIGGNLFRIVGIRARDFMETPRGGWFEDAAMPDRIAA